MFSFIEPPRELETFRWYDYIFLQGITANMPGRLDPARALGSVGFSLRALLPAPQRFNRAQAEAYATLQILYDWL
jgi:hypothetical protein